MVTTDIIITIVIIITIAIIIQAIITVTIATLRTIVTTGTPTTIIENTITILIDHIPTPQAVTRINMLHHQNKVTDTAVVKMPGRR